MSDCYVGRERVFSERKPKADSSSILSPLATMPPSTQSPRSTPVAQSMDFQEEMPSDLASTLTKSPMLEPSQLLLP